MKKYYAFTCYLFLVGMKLLSHLLPVLHCLSWAVVPHLCRETVVKPQVDPWTWLCKCNQHRSLFMFCFRYILDRRSNLQKPFLQLTRHCSSVLCCRATPLQKAYIVKVVKEQLKMRALAIGVFMFTLFVKAHIFLLEYSEHIILRSCLCNCHDSLLSPWFLWIFWAVVSLTAWDMSYYHTYMCIGHTFDSRISA
jgi:hypothetical protein